SESAAQLGPQELAMVAHLLRFGAHLRRRGVPATQGGMLDLLRAIPWLDLRRVDEFYHACRALLVERWEDLSTFDAAFVEFWGRSEGLPFGEGPDRSRFQIPRSHEPAPPEAGGQAPFSRLQQTESQPTQPGESQPQENEDAPAQRGPGAGIMSWSGDEMLRQKDFAALTPEELRAIKKLLAQMEWQVTQRRSRRLVRAVKGRHVDWLRSYRRNITHGGVLLDLVHLQQKTVKRPLIVLADISGSMDRYTRPVLQLVHTMRAGHGRVEAFVFGTRLTRVTRQLSGRDPDRALQRISEIVEDWAGGTRIGAALTLFNRTWARRVLTRGAIVIILSDGWDRGDPHRVREAMASLQRRCHRLIWLNPTLGHAVARPLPLGMQAAMPYIDNLLPARNLNDLLQVGRLLSKIDSTRPARRSHGHQKAATRA
ncbi:MAG TPA: VWA domain-containing protein, partial [Candidatus Sulfotelmatobacter sp.]|nr:VWA domain-containing protein [Candidatus Sulfotelmatobacter sp.]